MPRKETSCGCSGQRRPERGTSIARIVVMRRLWPVLAVALGAIAVAALVGALRRDSLSSTPGEVVEDFLERIARERYEKAAPLLAGEIAQSATPERLREWKQNVETGLGQVESVRGETDWISGEEAEATGILVTNRRERRLRFGLERESGRWRIARLDEFWGDDAVRAIEPPSERRPPARLSSRLR
jgi:hypothetical protein